MFTTKSAHKQRDLIPFNSLRLNNSPYPYRQLSVEFRETPHFRENPVAVHTSGSIEMHSKNIITCVPAAIKNTSSLCTVMKVSICYEEIISFLIRP